MPEAPFFPFESALPGIIEARDILYDVFSRHKVNYGFCQQCFPPEYENIMRREKSVRNAPREAFGFIHFEHPECSGGTETFLHWLPRSIELMCFDEHLSLSVPGQMMQQGLPFWPDDQQKVLRDYFYHLTLDWCRNGPEEAFDKGDGNSYPLSIFFGLSMSKPSILLECLIYLRFDPRSIAETILSVDTPQAWSMLLLAVSQERILDKFVYFYLEDESWEPTLRHMIDALDRRARAEFHALILDERLIERWSSALTAGQEQIVQMIEATETDIAAYRFAQTDGERARDLEIIRTTLSSASSSG